DMLQKLEKWKKKIEDKELAGKYVSLDSLDSMLNEVLNLKVKAVNEDRTFYMTGITLLMPFHATFERIINQMRNEYKDDYTLKRDFLLKHVQYFEGWTRHLPRLESRIQELVDTLDQPSEQIREGGASV